MIDKGEQTRMTDLVERLAKNYPTLPVDTVVEVVRDMYAAFNGSRVREFVPLFVERRAHAALTELAV
ncbi:MAG: hypothetical protein JO152_10560 [Mycobacteriaceae bacterium]|nr:hypothetical protein [Mycobacteriaceae bacterium]